MNSINTLLKSSKLWYARQQNYQTPVVPTGFIPLDKALYGGWPQTGLIELVYQNSGAGELALILPSLTRDRVAADKMIFMVNPPFLLNGWQLNHQGLELNQLYICQEDTHALWLTEQALGHALCEAVILWHGKLTRQQCRRLKLACEKGQSRCFWLHTSTLNKDASSEANLRLNLQLHPPNLTIKIAKMPTALAGESLTLPIFKHILGD